MEVDNPPVLAPRRGQGRKSYQARIRRALALDIFDGLELEPKFGIPVVRGYDGPLPDNWTVFCRRKSNANSSSGIHFFAHDYTFNAVMLCPEKYLDDLKHYAVIVEPDASQYMDMPAFVRFNNSCCNKAIAAYWQSRGLSVIPNVTWSDPASYEYSRAGLPKNSTVAINSTGAKKSDWSKYLWRKGYDYMVDSLDPTLIVRFGEKMPGEDESRSVYVESEHLKRMRYGR